MNRNVTLFLITTLLVSLALVNLAPSGFARSDLDRRAIEIIAERNHIPTDRLAVENSAPAQFSLQEFTAFDFKIEDIETGSPYSVALDKDGNEVSIDDLMQREKDFYLSRYGKMTVDLAEMLDKVSPDEFLSVNILLHQTGEITLQRPATSPELSQDQVTGLYGKLDQQRADLAAGATRPFLERLVGMGLNGTANKLVPIVSANIRPGSIREIAGIDEVERIELESQAVPRLDVARLTIRADQVQGGRSGNFGQGIQVAQVEVFGGRVAASNPFLSVQQDPYFICPSDSAHATGVAGIIASWNTPMFGIAPGVTLRAYGSCTDGWQLEDRATAAQQWGARILNISWSDLFAHMNDTSLYYDDAVINGWRTVVVAGGNDAQIFWPFMPPADSFNVITVGDFDDIGTTNLADDVMAQSSTRLDPASLHSDRQKPEVAAPGENINTTSVSSPFNDFTGSGTSFSAPMVTGTAALMMRANGSLSVWPEAVKAILMATAVHNIEGDDRLSDVDGAGGIDARRATDVARSITGKWGARGYTCNEPSSLDIDTLFINAGTTVRAAVAWDQNTSSSGFQYGDRPTADLDIQIIDPQGRVVASSSSFDNTYEVVRFNALVSGVYTLRVNKFRCNQDPRWLGWAWHLS
jgi:hypothetical protein